MDRARVIWRDPQRHTGCSLAPCRHTQSTDSTDTGKRPEAKRFPFPASSRRNRTPWGLGCCLYFTHVEAAAQALVPCPRPHGQQATRPALGLTSAVSSPNCLQTRLPTGKSHVPLRCSSALVRPPNHTGKTYPAGGNHRRPHCGNMATECHLSPAWEPEGPTPNTASG